MDFFLETYNPPTQNHKEMENLIRSLISEEIEPVINNSHQTRGQALIAS
jgi:hypothetical protein